MKNNFFLITISVLVVVLFPKQSQCAPINLAQTVEQKYNQLKTWQSEFTQTTYVAILKQKLNKKGIIQVKKPDKIRIEYQSSPFKIYITNGKKLWIYQKKSLTAHVFNKPKKVISKEALSFLSGLKNLTSLFNTLPNLNEPDGYLKIKNKQLTKLHLIPKDKQSTLLKLTLGIDKKTNFIKEAVIFNASGNVTHYQFNNINFDNNISNAQFELPNTPKRKLIKG